MNIKDVLTAGRVLTIINDFKNRTGINIAFELERINEQSNTAYLKSEYFKSENLGVLVNNFENVCIIIRIELGTDKKSLYYYGDFDYQHKTGGRNGIEVMDIHGKRFYKRMEIE